MNKIVLTIIALLLLATLCSYVLNPIPDTLWSGYPLYFTLAKIIALIMMLAHGTFYDSAMFKWAKMAIAILMLGAIFKIMHLQGADNLLLLGTFSIPVLYFIHFIRKPSRAPIDYVKVITVWILFIPSTLIILHVISRENGYYYRLVSEILVWIIFAHFLIVGIRYNSLLKN
jgi:hypothetical protein